MMRHILTQGSVDGFMGIETDDITNGGEIVEDVGQFAIPRELLVTLPIAEVGPDTKIIHIQQPGEGETFEAPMEENSTQDPIPTPAQDQRPTANQPMPGTSGVAQIHLGNAMEVEGTANPVSQRRPTQTLQRNQDDGAMAPKSTQAQPKKGFNTKNRKKKTQPQPPVEAEDTDPTLKERMTLLGEITELMKNSYAAKRNEMHVWGSYMGLKADRIPVGRSRDKVLVKVEELINEAIYEGQPPEE